MNNFKNIKTIKSNSAVRGQRAKNCLIDDCEFNKILESDGVNESDNCNSEGGGRKMKCPLKMYNVGSMNRCETQECAWWDDEYKQCCVKSLIYSKRALPTQSNCNNDNLGLYQTPPLNFFPSTPKPYETTCKNENKGDINKNEHI